MAEAKIYIVGKDRNVGAMVKALAREIAGFRRLEERQKSFSPYTDTTYLTSGVPAERQSSRKLLGSICLLRWP